MKLHSICLALLLGAIASCDKKDGAKDEESSAASESSGKKKKSAILTKKMADLTEDDLTKAATELGWGDKPSSSHSKGANETIIVSGTIEHPDGTDSPDGKKRIRMSFGLYIEPSAEAAEAQKKSLEGRNNVAKVDGNRVLSASYSTAKGDNKEEAQKILDRLLGE
jgi:hypothetical protein